MTTATSRILRRRRNGVQPYSYKLHDGDVTALDAPIRPIKLDKGGMSASAIFATTTRDRQGDILDLKGLRVENHAINPIVLWDHGLAYSIPIGMARTPEGVYTVMLDEGLGEATQTTYFSQKSDVASQIYHLVCEGIINANSFGFRDIFSTRLPSDPIKGLKSGKHIKEAELLEISWTGVPANPEAVRQYRDDVSVLLSRNMVDGKSLAPCIKSMLAPWANEKRPLANGATLEIKAMTEEREPPGEGEIDDVENTDELDADVEAEPETPDEDEPNTSMEPPSVKLFRDAHADMTQLHKAYTDALQTIEHPGAVKHFTKMLGAWKKQLEDHTAEFGKHYPDMKALGESESGEAEDAASGDALADEDMSADEEVANEEEPPPVKRAMKLNRDERLELARLQRAAARLQEQLV